MTDVKEVLATSATDTVHSDILHPASTLNMLDTPAANEMDECSALIQHISCNHTPHMLEKKQSSGDLHSRLKTRKLLGVGETPDGDVHRSKLSQILGHNDQLYRKLPRGLHVWQTANATVITCLAAVSLLFPGLLENVSTTDGENDRSKMYADGRQHGAALAGLSVLLWSSIHAIDKDVIRWVALASTCFWLLHVIVIIFSMLQADHLANTVVFLLFLRVMALLVSSYYCHALCRRDVKKNYNNQFVAQSVSRTESTQHVKKTN